MLELTQNKQRKTTDTLRLFFVYCVSAFSIATSVTTLGAGLDVFSQGLDQYKAGNYRQAVELYSEAIDSGAIPQQSKPFVLYYFGAALNRTGQYERALNNLDQAITYDPTIKVAYRERGLTHAALQQYGFAIADYSEALKSFTKDSEIYYERGQVLFKSGDTLAALDDYAMAIELNSLETDYYYAQAQAHQRNSQLELALKSLSQALKYDHDDARALALRETLLDQQMLAKPEQVAEPVIEPEPLTPTEMAVEQPTQTTVITEQVSEVEDSAISLTEPAQLTLTEMTVEPPVQPEVIAEQLSEVEDSTFVSRVHRKGEKLEKPTASSDSDSSNPDATTKNPLSKDDSAEVDLFSELTNRTQRPLENIEAYKQRGWQFYIEGEYAAAIQDFQKVIAENPFDRYRIMAVYLASQHLGADPEAAILTAGELTNTRWPQIILDFLRGNSSEDQILATAKIIENDRNGPRICEINFYIGEYFYLKKQYDQAAFHFQKAIDTQVPRYQEYKASKQRLRDIRSKKKS